MQNFITFLLAAIASTAAAAPAPKIDSPQKAMEVYFLSLETGDKAMFKTSIHASEEYLDGMTGMVDIAAILKIYSEAIKKAYPDYATREDFVDSALGLSAMREQAKNMELQFTGDTAITVPRKGEVPVRFRRIDGNWKMDMSWMESMEPAGLQAKAMKRAIPKIMKNSEILIAKIDEKEIGPDEAKKELTNLITTTMRASAMEVMAEFQAEQKGKE